MRTAYILFLTVLGLTVAFIAAAIYICTGLAGLR